MIMMMPAMLMMMMMFIVMMVITHSGSAETTVQGWLQLCETLKPVMIRRVKPSSGTEKNHGLDGVSAGCEAWVLQGRVRSLLHYSVDTAWVLKAFAQKD